MRPLRTATRLLCATLLLPAALAAPDEATATGTWVVDGKTTELRHACAFREPDPFGNGTNPCLLASNEPVPDAAVPDDDEGIAELLDRMRDAARAAGLLRRQRHAAAPRQRRLRLPPRRLARPLRLPGLPPVRRQGRRGADR